MPPQEKEHGLDNRAVGRSVITAILGVVLLAGVGFLLFGGVFVGGGDGEQAEQTADTSPEDEQQSDEDADDGEENDSDDSEEQSNDNDSDDSDGSDSGDGEEVEDVPDEVDVTFDIWYKEEGNELRVGEVRLRNDRGNVMQSVALTASSSTVTFDDLDYDETYSVEAQRSGYGPEQIRFDAGEFEREDIVVGYDFQSADEFRYASYVEYRETRTEHHETIGKVSHGDANYYDRNINFDGSIGGTGEYLTVHDWNSDWTWGDGTTWAYGSREEVRELDSAGWGHPYGPELVPIRRGLDEYNSRTFITRTEIENERPDRWIGNETEGSVDLFEVDVSEHYDEEEKPFSLQDSVRVYVDPDTGHVVRIETDYHYFTNEGNFYEVPGEMIADFWDHGTDIEMPDPEDLDREPPEK